MRYLSLLEMYRDRDMERRIYGCEGDNDNGVFVVTSDEAFPAKLRVVATSGGGWDHVSVSLQDRCPTWNEMEQIAKLFFGDWETAMQLHVPPSQHINCHPFCLHWWRPHEGLIPRPPAEMVGPKETKQ